MPKHPRKKRIEKPPPTPKKRRIEEPWKIREEDMPHAGEIWRNRLMTLDGHLDYHYLLLEPCITAFEWDGLSWTILCLETGVVLEHWFNFELDDWSRIA